MVLRGIRRNWMLQTMGASSLVSPVALATAMRWKITETSRGSLRTIDTAGALPRSGSSRSITEIPASRLATRSSSLSWALTMACAEVSTVRRASRTLSLTFKGL